MAFHLHPGSLPLLGQTNFAAATIHLVGVKHGAMTPSSTHGPGAFSRCTFAITCVHALFPYDLPRITYFAAHAAARMFSPAATGSQAQDERPTQSMSSTWWWQLS